MNKKSIPAIVLTVFMLTPKAHASTQSDVVKILEFYRTEDYLQEILPCVERQLESQSLEHNFSAAQKEKTSGLMKRIYTGPNLYKIFLETFPANYSAEKVAWKMTFLKSAGGSKLRQAYASAFKSGGAVRQAYYDNNAAKLLSVNLKNTLMTFITSTKQDLNSATMESKCDLTIRLIANSSLDPKQKIAVRVLKAAADKKIAGYMEAGRKNYEVFDFFLLKDHRIKEITELATFYSAGNGQVFLRAYRNTLVTTIEAAASTLLTQLKKK